MKQLDHIFNRIEEQKKQYLFIKEHAGEYSTNYLKTRLAKINDRIIYYDRMLKGVGKQGLVIKVEAQGFVQVGESNILSAYILYYNNINKDEALKLFEYEYPKDMLISITEITPGKKSKITVAK